MYVKLSHQTLVSSGFSAVGHMYAHFLMLILPALAILMEQQLKLSFADLMSLSGLSVLLFGLGALPAGWLADKWSKSGMMVVFFIGSGLSAVLLPLATSFSELAIAFSLLGLFAAIYHPVGTAWLLQHVKHHPGKTLAINSWAGNMGVAITALLSGLLAEWGWQYAFIIPGLFGILVGCALLALTWDELKAAPDSSQPALHLPSNHTTSQEHNKHRKRALWLLTIGMMTTGLLYQMFASAFPKALYEHWPTPGGLSETNQWVSLAYFIAGSAHWVSGLLVDKYRSEKIYFLFFLLQLPCLVLAFYADHWFFWVAMSLGLFLQLGLSPAEKLLLQQYTPAHLKATSFGVRFTLGVSIGAIGAPLVGYLYEWTGHFSGVLLGMAILTLLSLGVAFWLIQIHRPADDAVSRTTASD